MRYRPIYTNIVVELVEEKKEEKIITLDTENVVKGRVVEIGNGRTSNGNFTPMEVRPDSFVWFHIHAAQQLPFLDNRYLIDQSDILVIEED